MAKVRQVLKHVAVEVAARKRICHRAAGKHFVPAGGACLVIKEGAQMGKKNYCVDCARAIVEQAQADLNEIKEGLGID